MLSYPHLYPHLYLCMGVKVNQLCLQFVSSWVKPESLYRTYTSETGLKASKKKLSLPVHFRTYDTANVAVVELYNILLFVTYNAKKFYRSQTMSKNVYL